MTLAVCIVHWNTAGDLKTCLQALRSFPWKGGETEILVVDNGSTDGAPELVRAEFPEVVLLANPTNRCFAEATNQAVKASRGAYLLLLNPDARVTDGALDALIGFLQERPEVGVAAPRLVWPDGRVQASVRNHPTPGNVLTGRWTLPAREATEPFRAPQPMASCLLIRREVWEKVGPMDERFPLYFNDADWSLRAERAGVETWCVPASSVVHDHAGTTSRVKTAALWESRRAWLRFNVKHFPRHPLRPLLDTLIVLDAWRRTGRWLQSLGKHGGETTPEDWANAASS